MPEPAVAGDDHLLASAREVAIPDDLSELRALIIGPEQRQLLALQSRLSDPVRQVQDVSRALPDALALRATDPKLVDAVAPSVEHALTASVRRNPQPLADALFPIIGPAIRKAIAHALSGMMESFNRTLEYSLSWRSLSWRITALRTGKSFAEIVLLNTLVYRVEQVFLIEPDSGLLMQHVSADLDSARNADQISAMLTAIRDFVHDSFHVSAEETLETLCVGELSVIVEHGPRAVLAGVVRGAVPQALRSMLQETLETVHLRYSEQLESFNGNPESLAVVRPILQSCLQTEYHAPRRSASLSRWLVPAVILLVLGAWLFVSLRERQRWNAYLEQLRAEPGIVVISSGRSGGKYHVTGLRDPLARHPDVLLAGTSLGADEVERRWELYQAADPRFVLERARQVLRPPLTVSLSMDDQVLRAAGTAPGRWIGETARLALMIPGVRQFDHSAVIDGELRAAVQNVEASTLRFAKGSARVLDDGERARLVASMRQLHDVARALDLHPHVAIVGHTDSDGPPSSNLPLSRARAEAVLGVLPVADWPALTLTAEGAGSSDPLTDRSTEADKQRNRRVSFRVGIPQPAQAGDRQP
jgi:OOP family OmpA-OmpF porin